VAGWELGRRKVLRAEVGAGSIKALAEAIEPFAGVLATQEGDHLELTLVEEPVKKGYLQERRRYQEGLDLASLGIVRPMVSGRELLLPLFAAEIEADATVVEPQTAGWETAVAGMRAGLKPLPDVEQVQSRFFILRESLSLLYYPLYMVEFRVASGRCFVAVDGRDGTINAACAPGSGAVRWSRMVARLFGRRRDSSKEVEYLNSLSG